MSGLKLSLQGDGHEDPRVRFARVGVSSAQGTPAIELVTDAQGRLSYRLPAGEYLARVDDGAQARFQVSDRGWTRVRLVLP